MSDRGEKIVCLAQEILRSEQHREPTPALQKGEDKSAMLKAVCLAAFLSATGATLSAQVLHDLHRPATRYERVEIQALVFYTAQKAGTKEAALQREIQARFALPSLQDLSVSDYRRVRHYLWGRLEQHKPQGHQQSISAS